MEMHKTKVFTPDFLLISAAVETHQLCLIPPNKRHVRGFCSCFVPLVGVGRKG